MPKTYEYNGEIFTHEDMLEAYGDDTGVQNAVKQFGIKEQGNDQEDILVTPGKKKTVAAKDANATVLKNGASKKATGSSVSLIPGVNDFGAQLAGKAPGFKEYGQSSEFKKQQVEKNKVSREQQAIDQAKMEARNAASAERLRKQSEAHSRFLEYTKPKEEQLSELDFDIKNELGKDGKEEETMVYPKNEFQAPYAVKNKYKAFSTEKAEVIAELKKNQTLDKYNNDAISKLAIERYRKKKITSMYDNNAKDFMEDITDEEQAELKKASEEASINATKQVKYKALVNQRIDRNVKAAIPKLQEAAAGLKQYTKDYKFKSKEEYEEYKSKVNYYNDLRNTVVGLQSVQEENLKGLDKSQEDLQTAEQEFDVFKRHYGAGNLVLKPLAAFSELGGSILGFASMALDYTSTPARYLYSKTIGDDDYEFTSDISKSIAEKRQSNQEYSENYFQKTVEITDAESLGEYSFNLLANQIPNLILMTLSGGTSTAAKTIAGEVVIQQTAKSTLRKAADWTLNKMALDPSLQLMAAGGAGGKYLENVRSNDIGETNYNPIQMVASSLLWGYAEALGEKVTVDILKGSGRTLDALLKGDTNFVQKTLKQKSIDFFKDKGIDFLNENVSEQATNLIQNAVDKFMLGKNVGLLDNTGQVFKDTALLTGMLQSSPHIIGAAVKPFLPKDETLTIKDNALKIAKYMNLLKDNSLSFAESTAIEQKIKDLTDSSSEIMKGLIKRIGDMPPSDYDKVINLSKELADLKMQATEIYNSDSSNKEQLIKDLKDTHDTKKRELNKLVQETKILSKLDGNYTVQEKRDLYDLEVKAKNIEREIEGKDGAEVLTRKEELKQIREKQNNIAINSMFTTQGKGVSAINEVLKSKGLSGIEVANVNTVEEAIEQHDKLLTKLVEAGELTEAKAKAQKATFLKTIKSAEAVNANVNGTDYIYNIKERIDNEGVFAHEPGHSIFDRLVSKNPEDYKEIHDALLDHVKTLFGKSTRQNEKNALEYILAGVKAYQQHAIDTKQDYAYDELLQVVGDALQKYKIGMESMDPTFLQRLGEKIKEFLRKVLKIQNVDDIVKFDTGKDVYDFIKEYRRTFRKGELSKQLKASLEKGSIEGKLVKKPTTTAKEIIKPSLKNNKFIESVSAKLTSNITIRLEDGAELSKKKISGWVNLASKDIKISQDEVNKVTEAINKIYDEVVNTIEDTSKPLSERYSVANQEYKTNLNLTSLDSLIQDEPSLFSDNLKKSEKRINDLDLSNTNDVKVFEKNMSELFSRLGGEFYSSLMSTISDQKVDKIFLQNFKDKGKFKNGLTSKERKMASMPSINESKVKKELEKILLDFYKDQTRKISSELDVEVRKNAAIEATKQVLAIYENENKGKDFENKRDYLNAKSATIENIDPSLIRDGFFYDDRYSSLYKKKYADIISKSQKQEVKVESSNLTKSQKIELNNLILKVFSEEGFKEKMEAQKWRLDRTVEVLFDMLKKTPESEKDNFQRFLIKLFKIQSNASSGIFRMGSVPLFYNLTPGSILKDSGESKVFHFEHPFKSANFLANLFVEMEKNDNIDDFFKTFDLMKENFNTFFINSIDNLILDADGAAKYNKNLKGNNHPMVDCILKLSQDEQEFAIELAIEKQEKNKGADWQGKINALKERRSQIEQNGLKDPSLDILYVNPLNPEKSGLNFKEYAINKGFENRVKNEVLNPLKTENNVKPSLTIVSEYISNNKLKRIPTNLSINLLDVLQHNIEDYWGTVSDQNIGLMYQNIDYTREIVQERAENTSPLMKSLNESLNFASLQACEKTLNEILSQGKSDEPNVKASLAFNRLNLQTEKRELIKVNTDIASKYKSGQTKSEEDQDTITKNIERVRVINDILNKPEGELIAGVSEKNQKTSEKNAALIKIFKDINTDPRSREKVKMDLLGNNMGIIVNLVKRYWSYQQEETAFTKDDLKEELILQFFNMLNTYDPVKNPNFGAYIGGYLPKRIPRILENIGTIKTKAGEERVFGDTLSDEGAKQLSDEEENEYIDEIKAKKKRLSEALNISPDILEEINKTAIRALGGRIGDIASNEFKTQIRQNIRADLRNVLNRDFGASISYAAYLNKNWKILYDAIPLSVMNKRFQEFREPVLGANGKQLEEQVKKDGKSWRLKVWKKADISQEDFFGYFVGQYVGKSTQGTRKTALLETIAEELSFDVMIDLFTNNEEFKANFEEKQELLGNELAPNYLSEIAKQLDRDTPNTKPSLWGKKFLEDNNLSKEQGINILEDISNDLSKGKEAESVFNKFRKLFPEFTEFIDYFYNKVKNYITQSKISKNKQEVRKYNEGLVDKSSNINKDQIKKMNDEDLNEEIDNINTKQKSETPKTKASLSLNGRFNEILEEKSGIPAKKKLSEATAYVEGRGKGKWKFFIPPNTEDFVGLLYTFLPFGQKGERAMDFFQDNLIQPFYDAMNSYDKEKMQMVKDYKELKNIFNMKNSYLRSTIPNMNYTVDQAIRLWLWHLQGEDIQGIPEAELRKVIAFVRKNKELKLYAQELSNITKRKGGYVKYDRDWLGGTISTDIIDYLNSERRAHHLQLWQQNADEIFNDDNLNKIQAVYGLNYRRALVNSLARMKSGKNRMPSGDAESSAWLDFINGANANIMFFNTRSALLQLTATINYIDMDINNPVAAGKAFANQPQFWKDFIMLWNEDYLVERRGGARFDVSADEIATQASGKNGFKKLLAKLNEAGFAPTKYADSISAALGGASFYRTHYNHYIDIGYSEEEAHHQTILEWAERTETTNQSARPDKVSQIQSTSVGRLVFAFGNTSMQYNRLMKRAFLDIANKRGDWKKNAGKIIYYGAINNMIFSFLQNALFASIFGDDDDKDKSIYEDESLASTVDGIIDSLLKGSGIYGAILSTGKNMWQKWYEMELSERKNPYEVPLEVLSISPAISSKINKLVSASRTFIYKQETEKMKKEGFSIKNPAYGAAAKVLSVAANVPADRIFQKIENLRLASDSSLETWKRTMLLLGYNKYNLNIKEKEEPIDVLSKSDRKTFETYKDVEPTLTEEQYMEMKDLEPKVKPGRKNKKTWLNIFNPHLKQDMAKDPLTKAQRKTFEKYKQIEPTLTVKDFIDMNNISIREGSNVEEFEKISRELEERKSQEGEITNIKNREE